ncbi:hypothetical protein GH714_002789 [Hevea brasiliensis]|uniref:LIM zinc-binding domain-containing protein n=1 Tax=Hevea brasiliensis TaxID=3981 RepID=A0A6A6L8L2_HEVBR|nr:hypothetical protein GH714_002789 [Hevea brasiliensis]
MVFSGTTEKCKACDKTVHFIEMITADGISYHKTCFKCSHCNGLLVMSSYSSMDGVLYCKPHFDQLFRETGSFSKKFPTCKGSWQAFLHVLWHPRQVCTLQQNSIPFGEGECGGRILSQDMLQVLSWGCYLTPSSYAAIEGILYCKPHFAQLFKEKGCYNHLKKGASVKRNEANAPEAEESKVTVIMARKASQDSSYLEVEKSFYKNRGKIVEIKELPFDASEDERPSNSLDGLNLVRPVRKKGFRFQADYNPVAPVIKKPSQPVGKAIDNTKRSVPNVILRKPAMFIEDDAEDKPTSGLSQI